MNALTDDRPIVSTTTASTNPNVIGDDLAQLLLDHPDLELASIRLIREGDSVHIVGRAGHLTAPAGHHLIASEAFVVPDEDPNDEATG